MCGKGSFYHLIQVGARLSVPEVLLIYVLPIFFWFSQFREFFLWNSLAQLILFIPVVFIPANLTNHMAYVDIGWPVGLVLMAVLAIAFGDGDPVRKWSVGACMFLHGFRMGFGALKLFYPYRWNDDLPRYKYARDRFVAKDGMDMKWWRVKMNHDILQQAFANSAVLVAPIMLCSFNKNPWNTPWFALEVAGILLWLTCWVYENRADIQKRHFLAKSKELGVRNAVLGMAPFNDAAFSAWTSCRHPNYFGEWMSWNAFIVMAIPSLVQLEEERWVQLGFILVMYCISRFFYDCLNFWTGAEPAEHYSVQKREEYKEYQRTTRVFFPFEMPCVDHCRDPGWPHLPKVESAAGTVLMVPVEQS